MKIEQIVHGNKGFFRATDNDVEAGVMSYSRAGDDKIIIDHTDVSPAFAGKGIGKKLVMEAVRYARENRIGILPLCPFAKSVFDKDTSLHDVLF